MKIKSVVARKSALYETDSFPIIDLAAEKEMKSLAKHFLFRNSYSMQQAGEEVLNFHLGRIKRKDKSIGIRSISVYHRKLTLEISGNSNECDECFQKFINELAKYAPMFDPKTKPLMITEETIIIAKLNIDCNTLLAKEMINSLGIIEKYCKHEKASNLSIQPRQLRFRLAYTPNRDIVDGGLVIADKEFIFEPRKNTKPSERIFFIQAPTRTENLISFIKNIEKVLGN